MRSAFFWRFGTSLVLCLALAFAACQAIAQPVPEAERIPVDIRRTTLVVHDIDKSLLLYRDALGLKVIYDQTMGGTTDATGKTTPPTVRLVLLRANDMFVGLLGLMQRLNDSNPPPVINKRPAAGSTIMVINAKDMEQRFERIRTVPGVTVVTEPKRMEYPAAGGGVIPVSFSSIFDPDGFFIEINRIIGAPAGATSEPAASGK